MLCGTVNKTAFPAAVAAMSASFEAGLNSPANAAHVAAEAYGAARSFVVGNPSAPGSPQNVRLSEDQLEKFARRISDNIHLGHLDTGANKANLQAYTQTLIGANLSALDGNIQDALRILRSTNPTYYDPTTTDGIQHLIDLQSLATDSDLATKLADPDGPFGSSSHAARAAAGLGVDLSSEEIDVLNAIQIRNLAGAAQNLDSQYTAAGSTTSKTDVGNFINRL